MQRSKGRARESGEQVRLSGLQRNGLPGGPQNGLAGWLGWLAGLAGWLGWLGWAYRGVQRSCRNLPCPSAAARRLWGRSKLGYWA